MMSEGHPTNMIQKTETKQQVQSLVMYFVVLNILKKPEDKVKFLQYIDVYNY